MTNHTELPMRKPDVSIWLHDDGTWETRSGPFDTANPETLSRQTLSQDIAAAIMEWAARG